MQTSTIGQQPYRLKLLEAFKNHAEQLSQELPLMSKIASAISNICTFHSQYSMIIATVSKATESQIRKRY